MYPPGRSRGVWGRWRRRAVRRSVRRWGPLVGLCLVGSLDLMLRRTSSYAVVGLLDEPAHLLTTLIGVGAVVAVTRNAVSTTWILSAVLAGNLIDLDHVPALLGSDILTAGT